MIYPYSQINRLEQPHSYMYTSFEGEALLQSYQASRMAVLHRCLVPGYKSEELDYMLLTQSLPKFTDFLDANSMESGNCFRVMFAEGVEGGSCNLEKDKQLSALAKGLEKLKVDEELSALDLLHALIAFQLTDDQEANMTAWLDRLIQRFEVSKKLYESYRPGFRKGEGTNLSVRLYWLFSLALCLQYAKSRQIQVLSTLLKVCDLICSLPENMLKGQIPAYGLSVVLAVEVFSVQLLAEKKGVLLDIE